MMFPDHGMDTLTCVLEALPAGERATHLASARALLSEQACERLDLAQGYAFRFEADAFAALARFVESERKCCPFVTFEIAVAAAGGPLWLRMTGPEGTRVALRAELGLADSCGCGA